MTSIDAVMAWVEENDDWAFPSTGAVGRISFRNIDTYVCINNDDTVDLCVVVFIDLDNPSVHLGDMGVVNHDGYTACGKVIGMWPYLDDPAGKRAQYAFTVGHAEKGDVRYCVMIRLNGAM